MIHIKLFGLSVLLLFHLTNLAQCSEYLDNKYLADSCFLIKNYSLAATYYKKCVTLKESKRLDFYYAAYSNIKIHNLKRALHYLKTAKDMGLHYKNIADFCGDTLFQKLYDEHYEWRVVGKGIEKNTIRYQTKAIIDSTLVKALLIRKREDQKYRTPSTTSLSVKIQDSLWYLQKKIDLENQQWLIQEIEHNGWPGILKAGEEGDNAAWLIVQHADNDTALQQKCLTLLKKLIASGETNIKNIAYLEDRIRVNTNKKQLYGTQFEQVQQDGKTIDLKLKPTEDLPCLNKRRSYMELEPVEDYLNFARKRYRSQ